MAVRIAGRLGCGGGPMMLFSPFCRFEAPVLGEGMPTAHAIRESVPEPGAAAVGRIREHDAEADAGSQHAIKLGKGNRGLGPVQP
jgi:hypothetical protein